MSPPPRPPSESPSSPGGLSSAGVSAAEPGPGPGSGSGPGSWGQTRMGLDVAAAPGPDPPCPPCPSQNLHGSRSVPRCRCPTSARLWPRVLPVPGPASSRLPAPLPPGSSLASARFVPHFRFWEPLGTRSRFRPHRPRDSRPPGALSPPAGSRGRGFLVGGGVTRVGIPRGLGTWRDTPQDGPREG